MNQRLAIGLLQDIYKEFKTVLLQDNEKSFYLQKVRDLLIKANQKASD
jgi:hypothetical protein